MWWRGTEVDNEYHHAVNEGRTVIADTSEGASAPPTNESQSNISDMKEAI